MKKSYLITLTLSIFFISISFISFISLKSKKQEIEKIKLQESLKTVAPNVIEVSKLPTETVPSEDLINLDDVSKVSIPVLMYHSIKNKSTNTNILPVNQFEEEMKWLKDNKFYTLSMSELITILDKGKNIPKNAVVLTFDDGYLDFYSNAYPILKKYNFKATNFVITSTVDKNSTSLTSAMLKELEENNIEIQSHTVNHLELDKLTYEKQLQELKNSKEFLEKLLNKKVSALCYPSGKYNANTIKAAKETGYSLAFTTTPGYSKVNDGLYSLHRIRISPGTLTSFKSNLEKTLK